MTRNGTRRVARTLTMGLVLVFALAGCGSSGGGGGGTGTGGTNNGGASGAAACQEINWVDDGTSACADFASLTRSTKSGFDQLVAVGTKTTNVGITFKVVVPNGAIEIGKDYACDGAYVVFVYQAGATASHTTVSCTITVTDLGSATTPTSGTFSASLTAADGTPKQITSGAFSGVPKIDN